VHKYVPILIRYLETITQTPNLTRLDKRRCGCLEYLFIHTISISLILTKGKKGKIQKFIMAAMGFSPVKSAVFD
jgi:hypothetical protein